MVTPKLPGNITVLFVAILAAMIIYTLVTSHFKQNHKKKIVAERKGRIDTLFESVIQLDQDTLKILQEKERLALDYIDWQARDEAVAIWKRLQAMEEELSEADFSAVSFEDFVSYMESFYSRMAELHYEAKAIQVDNMKEAYAKAREAEWMANGGGTELHTARQIQTGIAAFADSKYFFMCRNEKELTKRYRMLAKMHHPDAGGSQEIFAEIQNDYETCRKLLGKDKASITPRINPGA